MKHQRTYICFSTDSNWNLSSSRRNNMNFYNSTAYRRPITFSMFYVISDNIIYRYTKFQQNRQKKVPAFTGRSSPKTKVIPNRYLSHSFWILRMKLKLWAKTWTKNFTHLCFCVNCMRTPNHYRVTLNGFSILV